MAPTTAACRSMPDGRRLDDETIDNPVAERAGAAPIPALLLFVSGIAALVYQLLWIKQLSLIVGVDVYAISIAIGAFFAGLALGGWLFGRHADRSTRPWSLYGALETGIGVLGVAATIALSHSAFAFAKLESGVGPFAWLMPFVLVGLPATLMGGTVPVLVRAVMPDSRRLARVGGVLYAANTTGAIVGTLLTVFLLIPSFGVRGSALVAAALNLATALGAFAVGRRARLAPSLPSPVNGGGEESSVLFPVNRGGEGHAAATSAASLSSPVNGGGKESSVLFPVNRGGEAHAAATSAASQSSPVNGGGEESSVLFPVNRGGEGHAAATSAVSIPSPGRRGRAGWGRASSPRPPQARLALTLYSICGGIALGYEVIWSQTVVQWTSTRSFAFAIVLATYLIGLSIGSWAYARRASRVDDAWGAFALLIAGAGLIALAAVAMLGAWLQPVQVRVATFAFNLTHSELLAMALRFATATAWIVLLPTVLLGAAFPLVLRLAASADTSGRDTGSVIALNTLGGIVGTALTGFLLVPKLGLERSLALLALCACVVGAIAVTQGAQVGRSLRWATLACTALAVFGAATIRPDHLATLLAKSRHGDLVFFQPGAGGTVAVIEQGSAGNRFRRLYVDGVSNSGDSMTSLRYMRLQALLPLIVHRGEPRSALVIGLGTGITAGSLLRYPDLETRVVAELLPGIVNAAPLFNGNYAVSSDPRVEIRLRDGRRELLRNEQSYDLITLEPPPPSAAGVVNLYSSDFYALAARRLNTDGILAQWLPLPTQTDADTRSLVRSFLDVFPHATLWTTELHEMLLIGSLQPIELDVARIAARFDRPEVAAALREVGVASPQSLLATWVMDRTGLQRYAGDALPVTDDDPRIEYGPWVLPDEFGKVLPRLLALRSDPPLIGAGDPFRTATASDRQRLLTLYQAGIHAYRGERTQWAQTLRPLLSEDPQNPYYRWFVRAP